MPVKEREREEREERERERGRERERVSKKAVTALPNLLFEHLPGLTVYNKFSERYICITALSQRNKFAQSETITLATFHFFPA